MPDDGARRTATRAITDRSFFEVDADVLAPRLLGCTLARVLSDGTRLAGRIVETEAYLGVRDRAAHSFGGRRTARTEPMYARGGTAYVYFVYGMHWCFNVVCAAEGDPQAVLVRALEPVEGIQTMRTLRWGSATSGRPVRELCAGPARVCAALGIDRRHTGLDLCGTFPQGGPGSPGDKVGTIAIEPADLPADTRIVRGRRVGVDYAGAWAQRPLRYAIADSGFVSVSMPDWARWAESGECPPVDRAGEPPG